MYLRTTKRQNQDGSVVEYFQLAHNIRNPKTNKPVAQIIHNFGRADQLDRDSLVRLCRSIARVCRVEVHDTPTMPAETASGHGNALLPDAVKLIRHPGDGPGSGSGSPLGSAGNWTGSQKDNPAAWLYPAFRTHRHAASYNQCNLS
jgi:hypothetical protein